MSILSIGAEAISSVIRNTRYRIRSFAKHQKDVRTIHGQDQKMGLPLEQQDLQDYLKNAPKEFRKYNRSSKLYEPKVPRGKSKQTGAFQDFIKELNYRLNTSDTYSELDKYIEAYKEQTGIELDYGEASLLKSISAEVKNASGFGVGTNYTSREYASRNALVYQKKLGNTDMTPYEMDKFVEERSRQFEHMQVNEIYNYIDDYFNGNLNFNDEVPW